MIAPTWQHYAAGQQAYRPEAQMSMPEFILCCSYGVNDGRMQGVMRRDSQDETPKRVGAPRPGGAPGGWARRLGGALVRGSWVICLLRWLIVLELCWMVTGVASRWGALSDKAIEAARMQMAVIEARHFAQDSTSSGASIVGSTVLPEVVAEEGDAPTLRPRDVPNILSDETGDYTAVLTSIGASGEEPAAPAAGDDEAQEADERNDEVETLIRKGVAAMIEGDMRLCILSLEQAAAQAPNHPALLYYYGLAYDKLLNPNKARDYYNRLYQMRDRAGKYFERAARRLTYGVEGASALRGKLAFGPHKEQRSYDPEEGERVSILLPILLAPGEEVSSDDILIRVDCFELVNGRKVDFSREKPKASWVNEVQTWESGEEDVVVNYVPPQEVGMDFSSGESRYYGFVAKMYYKDEPMDCISTPNSLILHEQMLNSRRRGWSDTGLLPDDGLDPYAEEATPYSQEYDTTTPLP